MACCWWPHTGGLGAGLLVHADAVHLLHLEHVLVLERYEGVISGAYEATSARALKWLLVVTVGCSPVLSYLGR